MCVDIVVLINACTESSIDVIGAGLFTLTTFVSVMINRKKISQMLKRFSENFHIRFSAAKCSNFGNFPIFLKMFISHVQSPINSL